MQVDRADGREGDDQRQGHGEGKLPEGHLQRTDTAQAASLDQRGNRITGGRPPDREGSDGGGPQRLPDQIGRDQDAGTHKADSDAHVVEPARPLRRGNPEGEDGGPQRRRRVQDTGQGAADRQFAEAEPEPWQGAAEDGDGHEGQQALPGARGKRRLPARREDQRDGGQSRGRAQQHHHRRAHVLYRDLDEQEAGAPDEGQQSERGITSTHQVIMRRGDVTYSAFGWARWRARKYSGTEFIGGRSWSSISFCSIQ